MQTSTTEDTMAVQWIRAQELGRGAFGTVNLAVPINDKYNPKYPPLMAVKTCPMSHSDSLMRELDILSQLHHCPEIIRSFGDDITSEDGQLYYNLFLEYASQGNLSDLLSNSGGTLKVEDVKECTKSILKGLSYMHDKGIVHGDIKLENILVLEDGSYKIADLGLAKRVSEQKNDKYELQGTPLYMSPELFVTGKPGFPADIWALGCVVLNLITGKPAWQFSVHANMVTVIYKIGMCNESPEVPSDLCNEVKDFLEKCLKRDPNERWTAKKLLDHPFITGFDECGGEKLVQVNNHCVFSKGDLDWEMEYLMCSWGLGPSSGLECRVRQMVMNEEGHKPKWCHRGLIGAC